ncbi:hypothetical protein HMPREF1531_00035 [Propionibacterium sp. oral taxon 192 str. F0372]|nr:hypothetical protein HMPREF1531_00035 [Propionibacterium sp. oral taxon 192 str. F0372]
MVEREHASRLDVGRVGMPVFTMSLCRVADTATTRPLRVWSSGRGRPPAQEWFCGDGGYIVIPPSCTLRLAAVRQGLRPGLIATLRDFLDPDPPAVHRGVARVETSVDLSRLAA